MYECACCTYECVRRVYACVCCIYVSAMYTDKLLQPAVYFNNKLAQKMLGKEGTFYGSSRKTNFGFAPAGTIAHCFLEPYSERTKHWAPKHNNNIKKEGCKKKESWIFYPKKKKIVKRRIRLRPTKIIKMKDVKKKD